MRTREPRRVACGVATAGLLVLAGAGYALKDRLMEEWYLGRLGRGGFVERFAAARILGELRSPRAPPGVVALLRESRDHVDEAREVWGATANPCRNVGGVLVQIGPPAIPALDRALEQTDGSRELWRREACRALVAIGTETALPSLVARVEDVDGCVGLIAVNGLRSFGPRAVSATPALTRALGSELRYLRSAAKHALEAIQAGAGETPIPADWARGGRAANGGRGARSPSPRAGEKLPGEPSANGLNPPRLRVYSRRHHIR